MSADNGYILRKNSAEKFVLQMYFASADDYPDISDANHEQIFNTLEEAIEAYERITSSGVVPVEYGLTVKIKQVTNEAQPVHAL